MVFSIEISGAELAQSNASPAQVFHSSVTHHQIQILAIRWLSCPTENAGLWNAKHILDFTNKQKNQIVKAHYAGHLKD